MLAARKRSAPVNGGWDRGQGLTQGLEDGRKPGMMRNQRHQKTISSSKKVKLCSASTENKVVGSAANNIR